MTLRGQMSTILCVLDRVKSTHHIQQTEEIVPSPDT